MRAERAVIGVPAHFTQAQRDATRRAATAARVSQRAARATTALLTAHRAVPAAARGEPSAMGWVWR